MKEILTPLRHFQKLTPAKHYFSLLSINGSTVKNTIYQWNSKNLTNITSLNVSVYNKMHLPKGLKTYQNKYIISRYTGVGRWIAVTHYSSPYFTLLEWKNETQLIKKAEYNLGNTAYGVAFSPNGQYIVCGTYGHPNVHLLKWDGTSLTKVAEYTLPNASSHSCYSVDFSPDNQYIVCGYSNFYGNYPYVSILKWDGTSLTELDNYNVGGNCYGVHFSPNGQYIACAHIYSPCITLLKWDGISLTKVAEYDLGGNSECKLKFSPDGQYIAAGHTNSPYFGLLQWDGSTLTKVADYTLPSTCFGVAFSPDGQYIACAHSGSPYFTLLKWDGTNLTKVAENNLPVDYPSKACSFDISGQYLVVTYTHTPYLSIFKWDGTNLTRLDDYTLPGESWDCEFY